ncbi:MAG: FecR family protein [Gallionella sp.]
MKFNRTIYLQATLLAGALLSSGAWAASASCAYPASATGGTGMGGTGMIAKGTGMGGTGMKLAGNVIYSHGTVNAQSNGQSRLLAKGDPVCVGETIVTAQTGMAQIRMVDDAMIAVRPDTQIKIEKYAFNETDSDASLISLFKGASRFITGKLGKLHPQFDLIKTPNATIGVRGTDHEATVILPGNSGGYQSGTYDKVLQGVTYIKTDRGEIDIHPNQVGLAADIAKLPTLLNAIPDFYKTDPSIRGRNEQSDHGKSGEGRTGSRIEGSSSGGQNDHRSESGPSKHDSHDSYPDLRSPESRSPLQMPESQSLPGMSESQSIPGSNGLPESH